MTLRTSGHSRTRRDLARELAAEHQVPYPLAFAAVCAGIVARALELAAELAPLPASPVQRIAAFTAAVETLTSRPWNPRLHPAVAPASVTRSTGATP